MRYDLSNELHVQQLKAKVEKLIADKATVELTEKKPRSLRQNAYLHVCIAYLALQFGETVEYVKRNYFKLQCNHEMFIRDKWDSKLQRKVRYLRSSADLTTEELTTAIERFRNWAAVQGVYIPDAEEYKALMQMQTEIDRAKIYRQ